MCDKQMIARSTIPFIMVQYFYLIISERHKKIDCLLYEFQIFCRQANFIQTDDAISQVRSLFEANSQGLSFLTEDSFSQMAACCETSAKLNTRLNQRFIQQEIRNILT